MRSATAICGGLSIAALELGHVSLADALALTLLMGDLGDERWPRAAAR